MDRKTVFVAFAMEDEKCRDLLKMQARQERSPFDFIDMSVKEPYPQQEWKEKTRARIRRSDGVIALISENSLNSSGQKWEIQCARKEGKKVMGLWCYKDDHTQIARINQRIWTWDNVTDFIDSL